MVGVVSEHKHSLDHQVYLICHAFTSLFLFMGDQKAKTWVYSNQLLRELPTTAWLLFKQTQRAYF